MSALPLPPVLSEAPPLRFADTFHALGDRFHTALPAQGVPDPHWVVTSDACAADLGLPPDWTQREEWHALQVFSGNAVWPGMRTLAGVYSGHQFGVWAGQLGDGRALLLGEVDSPTGPLEIQLKGSGLTPYSRMGDGRAVLRSSIREFLCSEAMHALGVPTTRALCVTGSPLPVRRETIETAAVCTRVSPSFIRFGHFEHFTHTAQDPDALRTLADHVIDRFEPQCRSAAQPYVALLETVARKTGELMAHWQSIGFCHGVMNTDNMSILGLTIDYGPFGFLDGFDPGHICNHSDHQGRYAYARQPNAAFWNLHALAQGLMPLIDEDDDALDALEAFKPAFANTMQSRMRAKLGLRTAQDSDPALIDSLLKLMAAERTDFTIAFRRLSRFQTADGADNAPVRDLFVDREAFDAWAAQYRTRLAAENSIDAERALAMDRTNPKFILRNHLAQEAIHKAEQGDFSETARLLKVLQRPFDEQPEHAADADFPPDWAQHIEVSCSS
ncbi:protein adenylyltransferase SelO [Piscinibacter terrae]|uniref:Protein nucleotidyltransferase YdiU n=1 Tax=Piscinibacter terrae TaxID=2496871 RepID=A0A3N7HSC3_9BURK|nr:YdiU family protein [Albitalea terrae]RQP23721.1 YdiU family protein [Albitalea terrae]